MIISDDRFHMRDEFADAGEAAEILEHAMPTFGRGHVDQAIEESTIGLLPRTSGEGGNGQVRGAKDADIPSVLVLLIPSPFRLATGDAQDRLQPLTGFVDGEASFVEEQRGMVCPSEKFFELIRGVAPGIAETVVCGEF